MAQREREGPDRAEAEVGGDGREGRPSRYRERYLHLGAGPDGFDRRSARGPVLGLIGDPHAGRGGAGRSQPLAVVRHQGHAGRVSLWNGRHRQVDDDVQQAGTVGLESA